jgi:hypothetical protein
MFEAFQEKFPRDPWRRLGGGSAAQIPAVRGLSEFFHTFGGSSFRGGLYRAVDPADLSRWNERISFMFPRFEGRIICFGYDWAGNGFALDAMRLEHGQPGVILFAPGTGEALEVPKNIQSFHDIELVRFGEAALGVGSFDRWLAAGGSEPKYEQCIGYKVPLFLNGVDKVDNLEVSDLDVYWHIMGQIREKIKHLPPGTRINNVKIRD